jgi:DNA (cytosine-5)-methyltransferase 1
MKIGSLFDGSGGFPLAATMCGIEPVWAAEIEPYPIAVTRSRFPNMKHLGSVTDIRGDEIEPVDVITFGSPCQDLSVAGKRAGLKHTENGDDETTRSGLFMEAIRIIKEMREATNGVYPRIAVWENVPGAFSSNKGEDFRIVLEEFIKVVEPTATMPAVPKNGWAYADVYCGDGWSLAYRVLDAQYWGVPQRRRRIFLVADFRGRSAGKISFEREGLRGYFAESGAQREAAAGDAEGGVGTADRAVAFSFDSLASNSMKSANPHSGCRQTEISKCLDTTIPDPSKNQGGVAVVEPIPYTLKIRSGCDVDANGKSGGKGALIQKNLSATLAVAQDQYLFQPVSIENHPADSRVNIDDSGKVQTLTSRMGTGGGNVPMVMEPVAYNGENITSPLNKANPQPGDPCHTLGTDSRNYLVYCLQGNGIDRADTAGCNGKGWNDETCYTLNTIDRPAVVYAETYQKVTGPLMANSHPGSYTGQDAYNDMFVVGKECPAYSMKSIARNGVPLTEQANPICASDYKDPDIVAHPVIAGVDCRNAVELTEQTNALQAVAGHSLNGNNVVRVRYIVRRLTPTECARLQGFPDEWAHIDEKSDFTDEEYAFWLEVRNTHAAINDKAVKDYTREQMLTWYNKLHTDSAEYKLWGNGIALPCVLYVMQGIAEVLNEN